MEGGSAASIRRRNNHFPGGRSAVCKTGRGVQEHTWCFIQHFHGSAARICPPLLDFKGGIRRRTFKSFKMCLNGLFGCHSSDFKCDFWPQQHNRRSPDLARCDFLLFPKMKFKFWHSLGECRWCVCITGLRLCAAEKLTTSTRKMAKFKSGTLSDFYSLRTF